MRHLNFVKEIVDMGRSLTIRDCQLALCPMQNFPIEEPLMEVCYVALRLENKWAE